MNSKAILLIVLLGCILESCLARFGRFRRFGSSRLSRFGDRRFKLSSDNRRFRFDRRRRSSHRPRVLIEPVVEVERKRKAYAPEPVYEKPTSAYGSVAPTSTYGSNDFVTDNSFDMGDDGMMVDSMSLVRRSLGGVLAPVNGVTSGAGGVLGIIPIGGLVNGLPLGGVTGVAVNDVVRVAGDAVDDVVDLTGEAVAATSNIVNGALGGATRGGLGSIGGIGGGGLGGIGGGGLGGIVGGGGSGGSSVARH